MNKAMKKGLALALVVAMALSACSSAAEQKPAETPAAPSTPSTSTPAAPETPAAPAEQKEDKYQIKELVLGKLASNELDSFNVLKSQTGATTENVIQFVDGLCETDNLGRVTPGLATEWETKDGGETWTFKLRDGVVWVDWQGNEMSTCGSEDFATGLEWVLNFHKNEASNASMPMETIKGATEYYNWTKELPEEEAVKLTAEPGSKFMEMVGIETPDPLTVIYHCNGPKPYFHTLAPYVGMFPLDQGAVDAAGGPKAYAGTDNTGIWYNGPYTCTEYIHQNSKIFNKNEKYWDKDAFLFDNVRYMYCESEDVMYQLFQNGEIDYCSLTESTLSTIMGDTSHPLYNYVVPALPSGSSYSAKWNYDKHNQDGTPDESWNKAMANLNFRKSIWHGLDWTEYNKRTNPLDPQSQENNFYTMKGLAYTSDGTDYIELVREELGWPKENGEKYFRLDAEKAADYKAKAMEELTAIGVEFPVHLTYYLQAGNQTAMDTATVFKNSVKECLGDDYIVVDICTYVSSFTQEARIPRYHAFTLNGWFADYGDPMNYLGQEIKGNDNAFYATTQTNINDVPHEDWSADLHAAYDEFTRLVREADAIGDDLDARYRAFAKAEAVMLENCLATPYQYQQRYCLTRVNIHSQMNAMFGSCNGKMKNWETKDGDPYTTAEMAEIAANKGK